jgi:hypothetical protein
MPRGRERIPADKARGGDIILRRGWERGVFIAGLIGAIVIGAVLAALTYWR